MIRKLDIDNLLSDGLAFSKILSLSTKIVIYPEWGHPGEMLKRMISRYIVTAASKTLRPIPSVDVPGILTAFTGVYVLPRLSESRGRRSAFLPDRYRGGRKANKMRLFYDYISHSLKRDGNLTEL